VLQLFYFSESTRTISSNIRRIIPQALCARFGLAIGANLAWVVRGLMMLLFIIAFPISKLLDWILGEDHATYFKRGGELSLVFSNI
jgi:metal transporter CNNM